MDESSRRSLRGRGSLLFPAPCLPSNHTQVVECRLKPLPAVTPAVGDSDVGRKQGGQLVVAAEGLAAWLGTGSTHPCLCGCLAGMCGRRRRLGWTCEWGCTRAPCWGASSARSAGSTMCGPPTSPWPTRWRLAASLGERVFLPRVGTVPAIPRGCGLDEGRGTLEHQASAPRSSSSSWALQEPVQPPLYLPWGCRAPKSP